MLPEEGRLGNGLKRRIGCPWQAFPSKEEEMEASTFSIDLSRPAFEAGTKTALNSIFIS
jgi:hypothetical protein